jgi:hypothetical protein
MEKLSEESQHAAAQRQHNAIKIKIDIESCPLELFRGNA